MLIELGHELVAEHDPRQVLSTFCRSSRRLVQAETAAVGLLHKGKQVFAFFASNSMEETSACQISPALQQALDCVVVEQRPIRLDEGDMSGVGEAALEMNSSFLGAPILSGSGVSGWFCLLNKSDGEDFTEADERLAATLATQVGVAYENARLYTEAQQHATELGLEMTVRKQAEDERAEMLIREQAARAEAELANHQDEFFSHPFARTPHAFDGNSRLESHRPSEPARRSATVPRPGNVDGTHAQSRRSTTA